MAKTKNIMKCTIKAKTSKSVYLDNTAHSVECKSKGQYTYGFYDNKFEAKRDNNSLISIGVESNIIDGWEVDGFIILKKGR